MLSSGADRSRQSGVAQPANGCWLALLFAAAALSTPALAQTSPGALPVLTRIGDIKALSPERAAEKLPVQLDAVVTYSQPAEHMLFVQDDTGAIYVVDTDDPKVHQGSRVIVSGHTAASYRNRVDSTDVRSIGEAPLPEPKAAGFEELIDGAIDGDFVRVRGVVRSSTIQNLDGTPFLLLEMLVDGGPVRVHVLNFAGVDPAIFLDSEVEFSAASGKMFDGKFEPVGVNLYLDKVSSIHVLSGSKVRPLDLPISSFERVTETYAANNTGQRLRVRGAVTLYDPGSMMVLDQNGKTLLVHTLQDDPLALGQVVDVIGFSDYSDYAPSLSYGQFISTGNTAQVIAQPISYDDAMSGRYGFNLVSLTGVLVGEVNNALQDELVLKSGTKLFSAEFRSKEDLPHYEIGSTMKVTGVCLVDSSGPYHSPDDFTIRLRSASDVAVLRLPSKMTVQRLALIACVLLGVAAVTLLWAIMLRRRVADQTELIRRAAEEDAAWERRSVYLEKERGRVLEAINSSQPLHSVLELIAAFVCKQIWGLTCTFHLIEDNAEQMTAQGISAPKDLAAKPSAAKPAIAIESAPGASVNRRTIKSGDGTPVAEMVLVSTGEWLSSAHIEEVLDIGARLAALAIQNRMLHQELVYRSEYDQLTDVPNRFLIEGRLERALREARQSGSQLAVIYVDLDEFKQVNDLYGHRIGDLYLQQTAQRLTAQLRDRDLIARIGGDEFLAIIHEITGREEAEGVAARLAGCFDGPFSIEDFQILGSASIGIALFPEDGQDAEELKRSADHAMYTLKRRSKMSVSAAS